MMVTVARSLMLGLAGGTFQKMGDEVTNGFGWKKGELGGELGEDS